MIRPISIVCALGALFLSGINANARPQRPTLQDYGITKEQELAAAAAAAQGKQVSLGGKNGITITEPKDGVLRKPERVILPMPERPKKNPSTCPLSQDYINKLDRRAQDNWRERCDEVRAEQKKLDAVYELAMKQWKEAQAKPGAGKAQTKN